MKKLIFILTLNLMSVLIKAQSPVTFQEVDTATYSAYLNQNWDRIIEYGKLGLNNSIDYYYLRMRLGYALFMKKKYRLAISQYQKALEYSNNDIIALEYLYYSYKYGGRSSDADLLSKYFPESLSSYLSLDDSTKLSEINFSTTYETGIMDPIKSEIINSFLPTVDGYETLQNSLLNMHLGIKHRLAPSLKMSNALNILFKDEIAYSLVNSTEYFLESQKVQQFNYQLGFDYTPIKGITFSPTISYLNVRIPIYYDYGTGSGRNRTVYDYITKNELATSLVITNEFNLFSWAMAGVYSNFNNSIQYTSGLTLTYYPLANLNLYLTGQSYLQSISVIDQYEQNIIQSYKIGFKVFKNLWLETTLINGNFMNFYDPFSSITYNSPERYRNIAGGNIIIPIKDNKVTLFASCHFFKSESIFVPSNEILNYSNNKIITYQSFTGGITWNL